jgi:hypothetical protein
MIKSKEKAGRAFFSAHCQVVPLPSSLVALPRLVPTDLTSWVGD